MPEQNQGHRTTAACLQGGGKTEIKGVYQGKCEQEMLWIVPFPALPVC